MMADNQLFNDNGGGGGDVFVYTGGDQEVPRDVKRVRIAKNVDTIPARTFRLCQELIEVEGHNKIKKIEEYGFSGCYHLRRVTKITCVIEIEQNAFNGCFALSEFDFDKLEIIGDHAFGLCESRRSINMPSVRRVGNRAFNGCEALADVVFGKKLERIGVFTFYDCTALRRIAIPLKDNLFIGNNAFNSCENLSTVDILAGEIYKTISSLHLETWRNVMKDEIDRINHTLPNTSATEKAIAIREWITRVLSRMEYYKTEHRTLLKEAMALLELALWKAKLLNEGEEKKCNVDEVSKKENVYNDAVRKEHRVTCGASIVIKNVLPFLALK